MARGSNARKHLLASACFGLALTLPAASQTRTIGDVVSSDASVKGSVTLAGSSARVASGSSINAGNDTASLRLDRGGEVRVCPHAGLSLADSQSGRDLVLGMGTGAIETHYTLASTADTILTPDFRILLAGPGTFNFAFGVDARGNTCIRSLPGDTASIIITEQMGDGVYQVLPGEEAYFRGGTVATAGKTAPPDCGCPMAPVIMNANQEVAPAPSAAPNQPGVEKAPAVETDTKPAKASTPSGSSVQLPTNSPEAVFAEHGTPVPAAPESKPLPQAPPPKDHEIHIQVDAPFVFRGDESVPPPPTMATLKLANLPHAFTEELSVLPPAPTITKQSATATSAAKTAKPHKGVFGHIRSFFASIFS